MSLIAFLLIFSSALLHALWHFMVKQSKPALALFIPISGANWIFTLIFSVSAGCFTSAMPAEIYIFAACGGICGVICDLGLSRAYRLSEVSLAYPLARALPVILTMIATSAAGIGKPLTLCTVIAMLIIFAGCLIMPIDSFKNIRRGDYLNPALPGIICAAAGTTGYTIFDNLGLKAFLKHNPDLSLLQGSLAYSNYRESFLFLALILTVGITPSERKNFSLKIFKSWKPYCAGVFAGLAYALVLAAMPHVTNVSFVQAFRQISLPIGMLLGTIFLHEKIRIGKCIGIVLIITGLILSTAVK